MKIVINTCYGGFSLSKAGEEKYLELSNKTFDSWDIKRDDPNLVKTVEKLGKDSFGEYAELTIVDIPNGVNWEIEEYDGIEWVSEAHRTWR